MVVSESKDLIKEVQEKLGCKLLVLFYNTEDPMLKTQLSLDVMPHFRKLLSSLDLSADNKPLGFFLHSSGGHLDAPWPMVTTIKAATRIKKNDFWVIVNDKAHSAATLLSLAADELHFSPYASLSPVDPQVSLQFGPQKIGAGIEDLQGYLNLIKDLFKLDEMAKAQAFSLLAQRIPPEILGKVTRTQNYIKLIVNNMLSTRKAKPDKPTIKKLTQALTENFYSHNYHISTHECRQLKLPVKMLEGASLSAVEKLYTWYREDIVLGKDMTVNIVEGENENSSTINRAFVATEHSTYAYKSDIIARRNNTAEINDLGWKEI